MFTPTYSFDFSEKNVNLLQAFNILRQINNISLADKISAKYVNIDKKVEEYLELLRNFVVSSNC